MAAYPTNYKASSCSFLSPVSEAINLLDFSNNSLDEFPPVTIQYSIDGLSLRTPMDSFAKQVSALNMVWPYGIPQAEWLVSEIEKQALDDHWFSFVTKVLYAHGEVPEWLVLISFNH